MRLFGFVMRKDAREAVLILLYGDNFVDEKTEEELSTFFFERKLTPADSEFALKLYRTIKDNSEFLLSAISDIAKGFKLNRIFLIDKCALLIGLCEISYFEDVPDIVAIDEAVNLSKKFSTEKSSDFVNGILAEYKRRKELATDE